MNTFLKAVTAGLLALTLIAIIGCASTEDRQGTGEYFDDAVITTKVKAAILNDPTLHVSEISVETFENVVQLSGFVSSEEASRQAVAVAGEVAGVKSVLNDMRIR
ncbi:MAG: BON domain-containing protein [Gammaproteobacteria bacterium]|nr:MAG: BON domain-containing protein [Gammaproteobacteria bacterium]